MKICHLLRPNISQNIALDPLFLWISKSKITSNYLLAFLSRAILLGGVFPLSKTINFAVVLAGGSDAWMGFGGATLPWWFSILWPSWIRGWTSDLSWLRVVELVKPTMLGKPGALKLRKKWGRPNLGVLYEGHWGWVLWFQMCLGHFFFGGALFLHPIFEQVSWARVAFVIFCLHNKHISGPLPLTPPLHFFHPRKIGHTTIASYILPVPTVNGQIGPWSGRWSCFYPWTMVRPQRATPCLVGWWIWRDACCPCAWVPSLLGPWALEGWWKKKRDVTGGVQWTPWMHCKIIWWKALTWENPSFWNSSLASTGYFVLYFCLPGFASLCFLSTHGV